MRKNCDRCLEAPRIKGGRYCQACANLCSRCGRNPKGHSNYCAPCHAAYQVAWKKQNPLDETAKKRDNARSKLGVYIKRGKVQRTPCEVCGATEVRARIMDYDNPIQSVRWLCPEHHSQSLREARALAK